MQQMTEEKLKALQDLIGVDATRAILSEARAAEREADALNIVYKSQQPTTGIDAGFLRFIRGGK